MSRAKSYPYEVAISYAGEDHLYADELVAALNRRGVKLWYAEYEQHVTWGKDLYTYLSDLYQNQARYCVTFLSKHYARKAWTRHELAAAQARAFEENKEYILPIRLDGTKIPGVLPTTHYISWPPTADHVATADYIADQVVKKLGKPAYTPPPSSQPVAAPAVTVAPIVTHKDLAARMAQLTHSIRDLILQAFERNAASDTLQDLYEAFKDILLPDLSTAEFADMFAQTLTYGLFAARYNHKNGKPFVRLDAAREIPKTNPFLRKLFGTIAGPDIDDEPFIGLVDELAQVLAVTDINAVLTDFGKRTRQQDPVVHFYETFLAQYDPRLRELRGVYYTPEPVISYIVQSVHALLRSEFGCGEDGLADTSTVKQTSTDEYGETVTQYLPRVMILDPACGTGAFLSAVIRVIRERYEQIGNAGMWSSYVRKHLLPRIFGFELLMAPYAMAHLNLSMQLAALDLPAEKRTAWAYDFKEAERLALYLTNTLEQAHVRAEVAFGRYISDEANESANIKKDYPVMVILGNPPYSGHSANSGAWIANLLHGVELEGEVSSKEKDKRFYTTIPMRKSGNYFAVDGEALGEKNPKWLNDDYVKFMRFAQWRIEKTGYGILAFITNNGYLDNPTFRGMRQSLMQSFDAIYILDLHGNSKKRERSPDGTKDENVFDIQQGVAIGIFVRRRGNAGPSRQATVYHADLWGPREVYEKTLQERRLIGGKYHWLVEHDLTTTEWSELALQKPFYLFTPQNIDLRAEYEQARKITDIFPISNVGIVTARDALTICWSKDEIWNTILDFSSISTEEARAKYNLGKDTRDWQVAMAQKDVITSGLSKSSITSILYRPFDIRYTYYTGNSRGIHCMPRDEVMRHMLAGSNLGLITTRQTRDKWDVLTTDHIMGHKSLAAFDINTLFPVYLYPDTNNKGLFDTNETSTAPGNRRPNLSPAFIEDISKRLEMIFIPDGKGNLQNNFGPEDIFNYMYAVFHSPSYRSRYAEFLKIDFPRLPLTSNRDLFCQLCGIGERLVGLHLMEQFGSIVPRYPLAGNDVVEKVTYTEPSGDAEQGCVWINKTQYFEGVPPDVWDFHVGGYKVCEKWLKDRKGRTLSFDDIRHYQRIVAALAETRLLMEQVDEAIDTYGGWPMTTHADIGPSQPSQIQNTT